jgi:hypothetical protein
MPYFLCFIADTISKPVKKKTAAHNHMGKP